MAKLLSSLIVCAIAIGVLLLRFSFVYGGEENWVPIRLPFPSRGFSVGDRFALSTGGSFALRIITPANYQGHKLPDDDETSMLCDLALVITGPDQFRLQRTIDTLRACAWNNEVTMHCPDEHFLLPAGGEYTFSIANRRSPALFSDRGALVCLSRSEPSGHEFHIRSREQSHTLVSHLQLSPSCSSRIADRGISSMVQTSANDSSWRGSSSERKPNIGARR